MSLPTDQDAPGSIPGSAVGLFSSGKLFHDMYELGFPVFQCRVPMFCPVLSMEETPAIY